MTLTGITWDHPRGYAPLIASSHLYANLFDLEVKWETRSLSKFGDQSLSTLAEMYDLLIIDHPHVGIAFETNCLYPLNSLLVKGKMDQLQLETAGPCFSSYNYKGQQWAIPVDAAMQCSAFRPDLLGNLQAPKHWNEVFQLADFLKSKDLKVGMALCPTDSLCTFLTITAQFGSPIQERNEVLVTREIGLQSLELMRKMRDTFHKNSLEWNPIQLYDYMSTSNEIAYSPVAFCYSNYSRSGFRKHALNFCNLPGINNSVLGGAGIAVSAKSKFLNEAANYAEWICSAQIQSSVYLIEQGQPANVLAWKSNLANELSNNFFNNTFESLLNAFVRPRCSKWPEFQKYLGQVLHAFLRDDADPGKVLDHLQESYRQSFNNK